LLIKKSDRHKLQFHNVRPKRRYIANVRPYGSIWLFKQLTFSGIGSTMVCVLVMEQDEVVRETLVHMIGACGYQVIGLPDAPRALGAMTGMVFDLLVAGIDGPDESIPRLLIDSKSIQPRLRAVTGRPQMEKVFPPRIADSYLDSPFSLDELRNAMRKALQAEPMRKRWTDL
jgi:DNA-binding response OmpR family regulator